MSTCEGSGTPDEHALPVEQAMPEMIGLSILLAVPAAFLVSGLAGIAIERGVIRFLYGRRNIIPFMLGTSAMPSGKFILLNAAGAVLWATIVTTGGYLFGKAMDSILGNVRRYELEIMATVAVIGLAIWLFHFWRSRLVIPSS